MGTEGTLKWDNSNGLLSLFRHKNTVCEYFEPSKEFERNCMFLDEMRHFISLVKSEITPLCSLDDGVNALEIAVKTLTFEGN